MGNFSKTIIPVSILIAGIFIAWAIYHSGNQTSVATPPVESAATQQQKANAYAASLDIAPVTDADHIQGDINSKVTIIEYSDTECPYCKQFHQVLTQIFADYNSGSSTGQVAWVYRQFPIAALHSKAPKEAEATECANELGGPAIFWKYLGLVFTNTPSNDGLDPSELVTFADQVGIDKTAFISCVDSGRYTDKINESVEAGTKAGATATPYTVILVKAADGSIQRVPLVDPDDNSLGALPYASMKAIIERLLNS